MSTLKVNTLEEATSGGATYFTAKAWVNFNGTGTVAIRDDGNVSSITDNGTGDYTVGIDNTLSSGSYAAHTTSPAYSATNKACNSVILGNHSTGAYTKTSSALRVGFGYSWTAGMVDTIDMNVSLIL